jgi:hypothetical protein
MQSDPYDADGLLGRVGARARSRRGRWPVTFAYRLCERGLVLRPHIDATALALVALRSRYHLPIVRSSLAWMLSRIDCPSAYSLAWVILAAAVYKDESPDVLSALDTARGRLAALVEDPSAVEDTSTIALAALALGLETGTNPFEVMV